MRSYLLLVLAVALASCASKKEEKETPSLMSRKLSDRLKRPDMTKRSIYDKSMQASFNKNKNNGAFFGRQKYNAKEFAGTKGFKTSNFKTTPFSGADDKGPMGRQNFAQAGKVSSDADSTFETGQSRFASQTSRFANKSFYGADDAFNTSANRAALKSQEKNRRPTFIKLEEQGRSPAYSEDQVRKLMGRN